MPDDRTEGGSGSEQREDLAYVCDRLDYIRTALDTHGPERTVPLEGLLTALEGGADLTEPLKLLHEAVLAAGDAAGIRSRTRGLNPRGVGPAMPDEWVLLCPIDRCSRYEWPDGEEAPPCRISGQGLRRDRL
ncbi:hypothetical protein ABZ250_13565 [Streptomyces afghaniensis]|uniref:hypothetical protein n=1 Tax=Streptomyces afghaniensis TaxID=66865 RepID=UPI0033B890F4